MNFGYYLTIRRSKRSAMLLRSLLFLIAMVFAANLQAQDRNQDMLHGKPHSDYKQGFDHIITRYGKSKGYIVYKGDTLKGAIMMSKTELYFEKYEFGNKSKYYVIKLRNPELKTIVMYNYDNKVLCITRIRPTDKKMHRVLHEGKLNIYDDWIRYIYEPGDIDPFMLIVEYNGEIEQLGSFAKAGTKRDLVGYINDIYGLNLPYNINWSKLMHIMDEQD